MTTSIFLAKVIGLYYIIISVAFIAREERLKRIILDMINVPSVMLLSGFVALIMGILLIVSHNIWVADWRVIITIVGWMAFLKGISIILFPQILGDISTEWMKNKFAYYATFLLVFIMGFILIYYGYING